MELLDLMIIISVFCDNAIEAAKESHDKKMNFVLFELDDMLVFVIENSTQEEKVDIGAIFKKGYSTKGAERGLGA
ncbi:GHKL domain-containing protein [Streptococcus iniae]